MEKVSREFREILQAIRDNCLLCQSSPEGRSEHSNYVYRRLDDIGAISSKRNRTKFAKTALDYCEDCDHSQPRVAYLIERNFDS